MILFGSAARGDTDACYFTEQAKEAIQAASQIVDLVKSRLEPS